MKTTNFTTILTNCLTLLILLSSFIYQSCQTNNKDLVIQEVVSNHQKTDTLLGKLLKDTLQSPILKVGKIYTVYLPPNTSSVAKLPVIVLTDGQATGYYAKYVEPLITSKTIEPIALIGLHSQPSYDNGNYDRYADYVRESPPSEAFKKNRQFFLDEFLPFLNKTYPIALNKEQRYLYGWSNGGAFVSYIGLYHPERFDHILAFSISGFISPLFYGKKSYDFDNYPDFITCAGTNEESIYKDNIKFAKELTANNINCEFAAFNAGHDSKMWRSHFLDFVIAEF